MEHILSLSYGKDSMACLGAIEKLGWPLDRIIHVDVWATDTIPADLPEMMKFKEKADRIIKERYGITVEHICAKRNGKKQTFEKMFYSKRLSSKHEHKIHERYGWPYRKGSWCNDRLKVQPLKLIERGCISYIGIAADEPERIARLSDGRISPLVAAGWTESDCTKWCKENGQLSPIYEEAERGGCWFCLQQRITQLQQLRHNHPDLWQLMLQWDSDSPVTFLSDGHTIHDFDKRFRLEDEGKVPSGKSFRWKMMQWLDEHEGEEEVPWVM